MSANAIQKEMPTWTEIDKALRTCDEKMAFKILQKAKKAKMHAAFLKRIYARFSRLRRDRETRELLADE